VGGPSIVLGFHIPASSAVVVVDDVPVVVVVEGIGVPQIVDDVGTASIRIVVADQ
jgi:hypothetical protein